MTSRMSCSTRTIVMPSSASCADQVADFRRFVRIQAGSRLVKKQDVRSCRQCSRDLQSLLQPVRQRSGLLISQGGKPEPLEQQSALVGGRFSFDGDPRQPKKSGKKAGALVQMRADHHVLKSSHRAKNLKVLKCALNSETRPLRRRQTVQTLSAQIDFTGVRRRHAADDVEQCCLARSVRTDNGKDFALLD